MQKCVCCVTPDCALVQRNGAGLPTFPVWACQTLCENTMHDDGCCDTLSLDTKRDFRSRCSVWRCRDDVRRVLNKKRQVDIMGG